MKRKEASTKNKSGGVRSQSLSTQPGRRDTVPHWSSKRGKVRRIALTLKYLKMDTNKKAKKTKGNFQAARQQSATSLPAQKAPCTESDQAYRETCAQILQVVDQACVGEESGPTPRGKQYTQSPPDGVRTLTEFIAWIANRCANLDYIRCMYSSQEVVQELLNKETKRGKPGYVERSVRMQQLTVT